MFHGHLDYFQKPSPGGRLNPNPGDHSSPNTHNRWFILIYNAWGPAWIEIYWNSIRLVTYDFTLYLRIREHTPWFWSCFGTAFAHFLWALPISWSRLLARVWSGPKSTWMMNVNGQDWSPHMSFSLKGSQILALHLKGWFKSKTLIQEYINKIQHSY